MRLAGDNQAAYISDGDRHDGGLHPGDYVSRPNGRIDGLSQPIPPHDAGWHGEITPRLRTARGTPRRSAEPSAQYLPSVARGPIKRIGVAVLKSPIEHVDQFRSVFVGLGFLAMMSSIHRIPWDPRTYLPVR